MWRDLIILAVAVLLFLLFRGSQAIAVGAAVGGLAFVLRLAFDLVGYLVGKRSE